MQPTDFTRDKSGRLIKTPEGYWAFVPNPLPPDLDLTWQLASQVSRADRALSELAGLARNLPNPHLLIGSLIRREAVLSSRIEGTQASLSDLFFFEAVERFAPDQPPAPDVREVANYVQAIERGLARLQELPVSQRLILELHGVLMKGVRGEESTPGEFRRRQNWIGTPRCTLMEATFVPPPVLEMKDAFSDFEKYLHSESQHPPLVRLAFMHYQFEAIHPFLDGNGRIGRLLISLLLCRDGLLPQPLLYLSDYFERNRDEYYALLLAVSQKGDWRSWVTFFLDGVADQSKDAISRTRQLLDLWQRYRDMFQSARSAATLLRLVDNLFEFPVVTISRAAKHAGVTPVSATRSIEKLLEAGIVKEVTGKQRNKIYVASDILDIMEKPRAQ